MAHQAFCDWIPCDYLQKALREIVPDNRPISLQYNEEQGTIQLLAMNGTKLRRVNLWYCPFCGTRIYDNESVLDWAERMRKGRRKGI